LVSELYITCIEEIILIIKDVARHELFPVLVIGELFKAVIGSVTSTG
jgi:hypothetical protein